MKRLQSLSYKTLFAILFFSLAGIVFFIKIGGKTNKVSAAWWDDAWHYRKAISITNSSGSNLTDFQVSVSIGTSQLITDGKMQSDCDDIRLTDINGNLLPYWIEENNPGCNSATGDTKIWLKANSLPTSGATVYIYYGNSQAVNNENGDNVFEFFDDFSTNLNKWTNITSSNWNISSGILNITPPTNDNYLVANKSIGISGFIIEGRAKANSTSVSHIGFIWHANTLTGTNHRNDQIYLRPHSYNTTNNVQPGYYSGGLGTFGNTTGLFNYNTWYNLKIEVPTSNSVKYYRDGVNENNFTNQQYQANTYTGVVAHAGANVQWDYFFIRKYASTLPTPSVQSEETGGGPIAYWKFDEGSGTTAYDSSSNQNNGTISGATWQTEDQCISGKCLSFNGVNKLSVANNNILDNTGSVSISLWVKPTTVTGIISIINRSGFTGPDNGFSLEIQDGKPTVLINNGRTTGTIQKCNQTINANDFTHLEWTRDISNNNKIFINGKECTYSSIIDVAQVSVNTTLGIGSKLNKQNIAPYIDYSNHTYNSPYTASSWGGDAATITYYNSGGYNNLPYKVLDKGSSGTGGSYLDDNGYITIDDNKTYIISAWIKANQTVNNISSHILNINRTADNTYRIGGTYNLTTNWQRYFWVYNAGVGHSGLYQSRHIIYDDTGLPLDIYWSGFTIENVTGTGKTNPSSDFTGLIDEVKLYNYARTADQIKQDYNSRGSVNSSSTNLGIKSNTAPSLKSGLIAYYKFDEGNGIKARNNGSLGSISDGTLKNGPTWINDSKFNKGLLLDGLNDYIEVPNNNSLKYLGNNLSISLWIKLDPTDNASRIISKPWNGSGQYNYWIETPGGANPNLTFGLSGSSSYSLSFNKNVTSDKWHHLAATVDSNKLIKLYIDGILTNSGTHSISNWTPSSGDSNLPLAIGTYYPYGDPWAGITAHATKGSIDEFKIYNIALTPEEIKQDYNQGSAIQFGQTTQNIGGTTTSLDYCIPGDTSYCAPPVAEWNFEENTGSTAKDTSGNNNNGTLYNSPIWTTGPNNKGSAINFDGIDDFVQITNSTSLQQTGNYTLETWFKPKNNTAIFFILKNGEYGFKWNGSTSALQYYDEGYKNSSKTSWNLNQWYHLSMVKIGTTASLYINGILDSSASSTTIHNTAYNLELGRYGSGYFNGSLDGIKIYNYARTPAQIAYDYNKGAPVGWWKMDECQGSTINDSSGNNNIGTLSIGQSGTQNSIGTCQIGTSAAWTNGASGHTNSSLNFDGDDDYINITNNSIFNLANNNYSIGLWFKSAASMTDNPGMILQRYTGGSPGAGYWIAMQSNKVYFENRADGGDYLSITSNSSYNDNLWHQVIITVDTATKTGKMYIDGNYIKSDTYTGSILNYNANMTFGGQNTSYSFNGKIDDVRIYNYALTDEQVKTVYNNGAVNFN